MRKGVRTQAAVNDGAGFLDVHLDRHLFHNRRNVLRIDSFHTSARQRNVFPTYDHWTSPRCLRSNLSRCVFDAYAYCNTADPAYLDYARPTYALVIASVRVARSTLQNTLFALAVWVPRQAR